MREIKFRGLNLGKEWIYFDMNGLSSFWRAVEKGDVKQETITQFTGLKDKNGKEIYEGDIIDINISISWKNTQVDFEDCCFGLKDKRGLFSAFERFPTGFLEDIQIIGNIHENPELIKNG